MHTLIIGDEEQEYCDRYGRLALTSQEAGEKPIRIGGLDTVSSVGRIVEVRGLAMRDDRGHGDCEKVSRIRKGDESWPGPQTMVRGSLYTVDFAVVPSDEAVVDQPMMGRAPGKLVPVDPLNQTFPKA